MFEVVLGICIGVVGGCFTGLLPGIHTNLVTTLFVAGAWGSGVFGAVFLVALAVTHTFVSVVPNIYLSVCEGGDALNLLPGQKLLLAGKGDRAVVSNVAGGLVSIVVGALFYDFFVFVFGRVVQIVSRHLPEMLLGFFVYLCGRNGWKGFVVGGVSGFLGWTVLNGGLEQPLFGLLSGLFGLPVLLAPLPDTGLGEQVRCESCEGFVSAGVFGAVLGGLTALFPGLGSGSAATIGASMQRDSRPETFLSMTGAVDTSNFFLIIATLEAVGKARNGSIVGLQSLVSSVDYAVLVWVCVVSGGFAALLTLGFSRAVTVFLKPAVLVWMRRAVVFVIIGLSFVFDGVSGLVVLFLSAVLGLCCEKLGVSRTVLMSCILLPVATFLFTS